MLRLFLVFLILIGSSCQSTEQNSNEEEIDKIRSTIFGAGAALNSGNVEEWITYFTNDIVVMRPNEFSAEGLKTNENRLSDLFSEFILDINFNIEEIVVSDQWAFVRATYYETVTPKNGDEPFMIYGKQLNVLNKQPDGSWLIARRIHNRNPGPTVK